MITNLQRIRKEAGLTQKELAERSSIPLRSIQAYETNSRSISKIRVDNAIKLAKVLKCKIEDLL